MDFKNVRLILILLLSFTGFLRYRDVSNLKPSGIVMHETHVSIFIEKGKADVYREGHWLHVAKLDQNFVQ